MGKRWKINEDRFWKQACLWWWTSTFLEEYKHKIKNAPCKCLSIIIIIDSVIKANKKYYLQTFLEECKYVQEKIKTENYIDEDLEKSKSDSDSNDEYDK